MAKKRRPARPTKKASSARKATKKKGTTKKPPRRVPAPRSVIEPGAKSLNLKVLREQIALALKAMSTKVGTNAAAERRYLAGGRAQAMRRHRETRCACRE